MFFNPHHKLDTTQRNLPHWRQDNALYFVTFRLADSIPAAKLRQWREERDLWLAKHGQPTTDQQPATYHERFPARLEAWLDAGMGSCMLSERPAIEIVAHALKHFDDKRYLLDHWVIMPSHVHLMVMPLEGHELSEILYSWKSFTAHQLNKNFGRTGAVWQDESFNRIVRDEAELVHYRYYILANPKKAGIHLPEGALGATRIHEIR